MSLVDWIIIGLYSIGLILLSMYLGKGQENQTDYYVGGRQLPWWAVGLSTMATQTSAISFISIPAFVALKPSGGLTIIQWEFALPLSMIFIMVFLIPFFRQLELISVYEYLESRFGGAVRTLLSLTFMISRTLATGVAVYAVAIVLAVVLNMNPLYTVILIGVVTIIYDTIGGMKAVVYSDVVQMFILVMGIIVSIIFGLKMAGGFTGVLEFFHSEPMRAIAVDFRHHGLGDGNQYNFWAAMFGLFFLYASYYGCDQTQVQRELSAPTIKDTKLSLVFNAFVRFIVVSSYVMMGITVGAALFKHPEFQKLMETYIANGKYDYMIPVFVYNFIPVGIKSLIFSAILAAAMSSLDSGINSLSAVFMRDIYERYINPKATEKQYLLWSKLSTATIGVITVSFAALLTQMKGATTVVELINKIGSVFYGPILATFLMGVMTRQTNSIGIIAGVIAGVAVNVFLWLKVPSVSWLWWNLIGCVVTMIVAYVVSLVTGAPAPQKIKGLVIWDTDLIRGEKAWVPLYIFIALYSVGMILIALGLSKILM